MIEQPRAHFEMLVISLCQTEGGIKMIYSKNFDSITVKSFIYCQMIWITKKTRIL